MSTGYAPGHGDEMLAILRIRVRPPSTAAFFLPYLEPGQRLLLDLGCGEGNLNLTLELARPRRARPRRRRRPGGQRHADRGARCRRRLQHAGAVRDRRRRRRCPSTTNELRARLHPRPPGARARPGRRARRGGPRARAGRHPRRRDDRLGRDPRPAGDRGAARRPSPRTSTKRRANGGDPLAARRRYEIAASLGLEVPRVGARFDSPPHRFAAYLARSVPDHAAAAQDWPTRPAPSAPSPGSRW